MKLFRNDNFYRVQEWVVANPKSAVSYASVLMLVTIIICLVVGGEGRKSDVILSQEILLPGQQATALAANDSVANVNPTVAGGNTSSAKVAAQGKTNGLEFVSSTIKSSIYSSGKAAGLSRKSVAQFMNMFKGQVNFAKDVHAGDRFAVLQRQDGKVVAGELVAKNKTYRMVAFTDPKGKTSYYTPNGYGLGSPFVRFPFKFKSISSKFSLNRYHPLLHIYRAHLGVDLTGDPGTPVAATSDGVISFAGVQENYGNVVIVSHGKYSTLYAHLSRFPGSIRNGTHVKLGQVVGYLGSTGLSTGPHLHYEFRIGGAHYDPLTVKLPQGEMIAQAYRKAFFSQIRPVVAALNAHHVSTSMYAMGNQKKDNMAKS